MIKVVNKISILCHIVVSNFAYKYYDDHSTQHKKKQTTHIRVTNLSIMARTRQTRTPSKKRKFSAPIKKSNKRRRKTGGKRDYSFSTRSVGGTGVSYKAKRVSRSNYKKILWDSSILRVKYRGSNTQHTAISTPANYTQKTVVVLQSLFNNGGNFWTAGGGAVNPNGGTIPTFVGNLTLRGGMISFRISNSIDTVSTNAGPITVEVMLLQTGPGFDPAALPSVQNLMQDETFITDFQTKIGRIKWRKTIILKEGDSVAYEHRLSVRKVDLDDHPNGLNQLYWYMSASNLDTAVAKVVDYSIGFNLSFCGEAT